MAASYASAAASKSPVSFSWPARPSSDVGFERRVRGEVVERGPERFGGLGGHTQARLGDPQVVMPVEPLRREPGRLREREQGRLVIAAVVLGQAEAEVGIHLAV